MATQKTQVIYNKEWPANINPIYILLKVLRYHGCTGYTEYDGIPPKLQVFTDVVKALWPGNRGYKFVMHPWAVRMAECALAYDRVGYCGCASSGKSEFMAAYAIIFFLSDPMHSLVMITSTTLATARKRVFGSLTKLWNSLPPNMFIGKIKEAPDPGIIVEINGRRYPQNGIYLVPADSKNAQSSAKLIGAKAARVLLALDELSELSDALITTAISNLQANDFFQCIAASNPASRYDPFGKFITPLLGWNSVTVEDESWPTLNNGICLHLDALKNINFLSRKNVAPIATFEAIDRAIKDLPPDGIEFYRMWRGFIPDLANEELIYNESDIIKWNAESRGVWASEKTRIGACDPAFTTGGDRCVVFYGFFGKDLSGNKIIEFDKYYIVTEDVTKKQIPRNVQICQKILALNEQEGCLLKNFAIDASGGGTPFSDILAMEAKSDEFYRIQFGGSASDLPVSEIDATLSKDRYCNRVTEIWFSGQHYLRAGQLKGVLPDLAKELCVRKFSTQKGAMGLRMLVESKAEMKKRIGKSPDIADAAMILVALCREKLGATPVKQLKQKNNSWKQFSRKYDVVSLSPNAEFVDGSEINSLDNFV